MRSQYNQVLLEKNSLESENQLLELKNEQLLSHENINGYQN